MRRIVLIACASILLLCGVAYASIPDASGVIHACRKNTDGSVRVIDFDAGQSCPNGWTAFNWNGQPAHLHQTQVLGYSAQSGPLGPNEGAVTLALCPQGTRSVGGGFHILGTTADVNSVTITQANDFIPISPLYRDGYNVVGVAGPDGSPGFAADVSCQDDPDR